MNTPTVPMRLEDFPQQRIYPIDKLPLRPDPFEYTLFDYDDEHSFDRIPQKPTRKSIYLCQTEWAWSPWHNRLDAYYLHKGRTHWLIWVGDYDDEGWGNGRWKYSPAVAVPIKGIAEEQAAVYLLLEYWRNQSGDETLDHYHLIGEEGLLKVPQIQAIASIVWDEQEYEEGSEIVIGGSHE